jgi:two-component system, NarL family, nitrate/nitrite response regulator NarL
MSASTFTGINDMIFLETLIHLTPRELEVLKLLTEELTSAQIAGRLHISEYTVESHRKNLLKKTGTRSVVGLVTYALRNKIA